MILPKLILTAPTLPVLRGLGLALTRLGKHDQAFKHLRAAVEMEPTHGLTNAYLALCGAKGRPTQPSRPVSETSAVSPFFRTPSNDTMQVSGK